MTASPTQIPERTHDAARSRVQLWAAALPAVTFPRTVWQHRYLVQNFFRRELLGRFRGSVLGLVWVMVHPMFLFAIYYLVFGLMFGDWKRDGAPPDPRFAIYLFSGVIAFQAMIEGTTRACTCVVDNGNLVKKLAFPSELMPTHSILIALVVYLVGAVVCTIAGVSFGALQPDATLLLLPVVLLEQFLLTLGIGFVLATCQVFARDVSHLWGILGTAWMFLTPVFWYPHILRDKFGPGVDVLMACNPAYPLLQAHRLVLGVRDFTVGEGEAARHVAFGELGTHLLHGGIWALAFFFVGYGLFMSRRHKFPDLV